MDERWTVCVREKGRVWERDEEERVWEREGESMGGGGRVKMVVGEGECIGKGGSFKGRGRKYKRKKGESVEERLRVCVREKERVWKREGESKGGGGE